MLPDLATAESLETALALARPRLVRLCARYVADQQTAEDLAQETLYEAWRSANRLRDPARRDAWLAGIARNVCLRWHRRSARETARQVPLESRPSASAFAGEPVVDPAELADEYDFVAALDHDELVRLLKAALRTLPEPVRRVLLERYVAGRPAAEIAQRLGLTEAAVAMRLQRARAALQRTLKTEFGQALADHGLIGAASEAWVETRLWCPTCGQRRLMGQFHLGGAGGTFALRCPGCHGSEPMTHVDLSIPFYARLLSRRKAFKPAYLQLLRASVDYARQALQARAAPCLMCGRAVSASVGDRDGPAGLLTHEVCYFCPACGWSGNNALHGLTLGLPEAQALWRAHPRLRKLPTRAIEVGGVPALVSRVRSVTAAAGLDVVALRDTFEIVGVHPATSN